MYEAAQFGGVPPETMCRAYTDKVNNAALKQLYPKLRMEFTKYRSSPDDFYIETIILGR